MYILDLNIHNVIAVHIAGLVTKERRITQSYWATFHRSGHSSPSPRQCFWSHFEKKSHSPTKSSPTAQANWNYKEFQILWWAEGLHFHCVCC